MKDMVAGEDVFVCHRQTFGRLILIAGGAPDTGSCHSTNAKALFLIRTHQRPGGGSGFALPGN